MLLARLFIVVFISFRCAGHDTEGSYHTNVWVVEVPAGEERANEIAQRLGFINHGKVLGDDTLFEFEHKHSRKRSDGPQEDVHGHLTREPGVSGAHQQVAKRRAKRDTFILPLDPSYRKQWYLTRPSTPNLNAKEAWRMGYTGLGSVVTIVDDGLEWKHEDLKRNYDPEACYDFNSHDSDPTPRYDPTNENKHGTRCAGEVAALKNDICTVGIAYNASIGGIRMLDGDVTDAVEGNSLGFRQDHIDIYSSSWGPDDDGQTVDGPGLLAKKAFQNGVGNGRDGKGSIFVWASGNGGSAGDSCSCDGYVVSPFTIAIGAVQQNGAMPWYAEECPALMAVTPSSGGGSQGSISTTDIRHKCTDYHTGTSAAAPLAAGVIALALQAKPDLTWRDVQYILALTSKLDSLHSQSILTNGAGLKYSHQFGFGLIDAGAVVNRALHWTTVPEQMTCTLTSSDTPKEVVDSEVVLTLSVENCDITYLEHVIAEVSISLMSGRRRGHVSMELTSPSATKSVLLKRRNRDSKTTGFDKWPFMTVANWGENPNGKWELKVSTVSGAVLIVDQFELRLHGTYGMPVSVQRIPRQCDPLCADGCAAAGPSYCDNCKVLRVEQTRECVKACPEGYIEEKQVCRRNCSVVNCSSETVTPTDSVTVSPKADTPSSNGPNHTHPESKGHTHPESKGHTHPESKGHTHPTSQPTVDSVSPGDVSVASTVIIILLIVVLVLIAGVLLIAVMFGYKYTKRSKFQYNKIIRPEDMTDSEEEVIVHQQ